MKRSLCAALALLPVMTWAQDATLPEKLTRAVVEGYQAGGHAFVLQMERDCWADKDMRSAAGARICTTIAVASGIMDMALQRKEHRGPMPDFAPQAQRARIDAGMKRIGLDKATQGRVMDAVQADVPALVAGLAQAGL